MGIATEHAPAPSGGMKPYTLWEIDVRLFNDAMIEIEKLSCRQDLWVGEGEFVLAGTNTRHTRIVVPSINVE